MDCFNQIRTIVMLVCQDKKTLFRYMEEGVFESSTFNGEDWGRGNPNLQCCHNNTSLTDVRSQVACPNLFNYVVR